MKVNNIIFFLFITIVGYSQNIMVNGDFENYNNTAPCGVAPSTFITQDLPNWHRSHGSANVGASGINGTNGVAMWYSSQGNRGEGIYADVYIQPGKTYKIKLSVFSPDNPTVNNTVRVQLTNSLTDYTGCSFGTSIPGNITSPFSKVINMDQPNNTWYSHEFDFTNGTTTLRQLWIYPFQVAGANQQDIIVDNVEAICMDCCPCLDEDSAIYTDSNIPDETLRDKYIIARDNAQVISGRDVYFQAGDEIVLEPNFHAESGAVFKAKIEDCQRDIAKLNITKTPDFCSTILTANACSPFEINSYVWTHSTGAPVGTGDSITVYNSNDETYICTITDSAGNTVSSSIFVEKHPYGAVSHDPAPNDFSPNGDGIDDVWFIGDSSGNAIPYNAYEYTLEIYNRWGIKIYTKSNSVAGPPWLTPNEISFDGGSLNDGSYYYLVTITNCTETITFNGWMNIFQRFQNTSNSLDDTKFLLLEDTQSLSFSIYPNPVTSGEITIKYPNYKENNMLQIYDVSGKLILKRTISETKTIINTSQFAKGLYFVKLSGSTDEIVKKIIIK